MLKTQEPIRTHNRRYSTQQQIRFHNRLARIRISTSSTEVNWGSYFQPLHLLSFISVLFWILRNPLIILYLFIILDLFQPQYYTEVPNHFPPTLCCQGCFSGGLSCVTIRAMLLIPIIELHSSPKPNITSLPVYASPVPTQNKCIPFQQTNIYT